MAAPPSFRWAAQLHQARAARAEREGVLGRAPQRLVAPLRRRDYLAHMKAVAESFDLAKVDVYKQLQRRITSGLTPVMELEGADGASASKSVVTVFGTDRNDLTKLGTVRREIHVALLDPKTDAQCLYPATILHSGLLRASDAAAGGISFAPRRFAYRQGQQLPVLHASGKVDAAC